jgi:alpha-beta hydrolase superfamily lysophospholipase
MQHVETSYLAKDGLKLYSQSWQPEEAPTAVVCLVHGIGEHSGRYTHVAEALCAAGYAVCAYDLRGHGRSGGPRGHASTYDTMLDDIELLLKEASQRYAGRPQFLYGHSLGGNLVLNYALRRCLPLQDSRCLPLQDSRRPTLQGVVATSPALRIAVVPPAFKLWLGQIFYQVWPTLTLPTGLPLAGLSRDPHVIENYRADPLVHDLASARFALDFLNAGEWALEHAAEFPLPLLLVHGTADTLTSVQASHDFAAQAGARCTLKLWEGLYHETHNEPEKAEVLAYLVHWLGQQL